MEQSTRCGACDGEGTVKTPCCEAYDVGEIRFCRCADRRGYRKLRCAECNGEGEIEPEEVEASDGE